MDDTKPAEVPNSTERAFGSMKDVLPDIPNELLLAPELWDEDSF
jgi:hypothetical protein